MYYDILQRVMRQLDSLQQKLSSSYLDSQLSATDYGKTIDKYFETDSLNMRSSVIDTDNIKSLSITSDKLKDSAVLSSKIQDSAITSSKISDGAIDSLSKFSFDLQQVLSEKKLIPLKIDPVNFGENDYKYKINPIQSPDDCETLSEEYFDSYTTVEETNLDGMFFDIQGTDKLYTVFKNTIYNGTIPIINDFRSIYLFFEYRFFHNNISDHNISNYPTSTNLNIQLGFYNTYNVPSYVHNNAPTKFEKDEYRLYVPSIDNSVGLDNLHSYFTANTETVQFSKRYEWTPGGGALSDSDLYKMVNYKSSVRIPLFGAESNELSSYSYPFSGESGMMMVRIPVNLRNLIDILGGKSLSSNFLSAFLSNFTIRMWLDNDYFETSDTADNRFFKFVDSNGKFVIDALGIRQMCVFYGSNDLSSDADDDFYKPGVSKYIYALDYSSSGNTLPGLQKEAQTF